MIVSVFAGCGKTEVVEHNQNLESYPVQTGDTLEYWVALNGNVPVVGALPLTDKGDVSYKSAYGPSGKCA